MQCRRPCFWCFRCMNDDGEMIGADFSQVLLPDTGREHTFETLINLPCQEAVSLIAVQVIPDPGTWMMSDVVSKLHELQVQPSSDDAAGAEHSQSRPQSLKEFAEDWETAGQNGSGWMTMTGRESQAGCYSCACR